MFNIGKKGRDVVFRGLAVPGAVNENHSDILEVITHEKTVAIIENYQAILTILDAKTIKRSWIEDLHKGNPLTENAPDAWLEWVHTGEYIPLIERRTINSHTYVVDKESVKYWLFNVYYAVEALVWKWSKELEVAAMQYEYGRENNSSVTRHINLMKEISEGDYIVAYSGNKRFLGYGNKRIL